jgi:hypothetical protein
VYLAVVSTHEHVNALGWVKKPALSSLRLMVAAVFIS